MVYAAGCSNSFENSSKKDTLSQPQEERFEEPIILPEKGPEVSSEPVKSNRVPVKRFDNSEWKNWDDLTEEEYEEQVEKLSERLDEITDEYYEDDDAEELDRDMLLEKLLQDLPEHMRYNLPEEVLEEIEWWAE
jgi:hypothetical protein